MRALIVLAATGCLHVAQPPSAPTPDERRAAYVEAHPELAPGSRSAILAGQVAVGMTVADVRAALGPETGSRISTDSRYELELGYRMPMRGTVTHVDGGGTSTEDVDTGARVCVVFVAANRVADVQCTVVRYQEPRRVPM